MGGQRWYNSVVEDLSTEKCATGGDVIEGLYQAS